MSSSYCLCAKILICNETSNSSWRTKHSIYNLITNEFNLKVSACWNFTSVYFSLVTTLCWCSASVQAKKHLLELENIMVWIEIPVLVVTITDEDDPISPGVLKNIQWCDSNCSSPSFCSLVVCSTWFLLKNVPSTVFLLAIYHLGCCEYIQFWQTQIFPTL